MPKIKWTKQDVIRTFQEAVTPQLSPSKSGILGLAGKFRDLIAKRKAGAATPPVTE